MEQSKQTANRHAPAAKENQVGSGEQVTPDLLEKLARRLGNREAGNCGCTTCAERVLREVHLDELLKVGDDAAFEGHVTAYAHGSDGHCKAAFANCTHPTCVTYRAAKKAFEESLSPAELDRENLKQTGV